ncbi:protein tyrosine phosphatase receptor type Fa isoform X1 [Phycodurus eques]|uniref:protein tyrosine phosphatase receptor type Fa isoform X1 n=1 Tax=Phycodurus eques TaxID=693459 RepID=UPI002ACDAB33|nr:protein tyrosine phosphatase receptor type Fa isoform X1 [Phycodurus eques]XP_061538926.1 protein tyrosine phosphatase receptor type Fa isoform X1 [Phycodurus eques]
MGVPRICRPDAGAVPLLALLLSSASPVLPSHADSVPSFVKSPDDLTGVSGGVASFVCQALGEPKPRITWMKKGKKVSSQRFEVIEFDDGSGSVLRIQPLRTHRDEAVYECNAANSLGEINTSAKLTVLEEEQIPHGFPSIDMGPQLKVVERTRTATMLCAASGNPDPEIFWLKDFLPVDIESSNGRIKQLRSGGTPIRGALQIENSEESDQGKYECVAVNSAGTRYSAPANLYVRVRRVPPRFSIPPSHREVMPGGGVNLTCVAVGAPMPYVKWMSGEAELTREEEMPVGRNVLELADIRQSANYTCVAISSLGVIQTTAQITVKALPKPPTSLMVTETTATSVTLTWDSGTPEPVSYYVIQYRAKGSDDGFREVDGVATTRYSIGGLSPFSQYDFRVMAVNNVGRGPPGASVDTRTGERAPSSPPLRVQARMLSPTAALVHWEPPEEANGQVRGYRVYYSADPRAPLDAWSEHDADDGRLTTLAGLTPDLTYGLRVLAFTSVGDGPPSDVLLIKTQQGVPAQPSDLEAEAELDSRIALTWLWPVRDPVVGYELLYWEANEPQEKHRVTFEPTGSYAVDGLKADTVYAFTLAARSETGLGVFTGPIEGRTARSTPSVPPRDVRLLSLSSTSIQVSWEPPASAAGPRDAAVAGYCLAYRALGGEDAQRHQVTAIGADVHSFVLEGLEKWTEYSVWVRALTDVGPGPESPPARVRTQEDVPGAPPRKVEADAVNSTAARVSWKPPLSLKQNGQVRGYQIVYSRMEKGEPRGQPLIVDVARPDAQEAVLTGLLPETSYSLTVAAYTTKGDGAHSKARLVTTTGAVPGKPTMMISTTIGNTALIQWQPPKEMAGEHVGYRLQYKRAEEEAFAVRDFRKTDDHFTVTGLHKGATYIFKLCAKNRAGNGEEYAKEISTPEDAPASYPLNLSVVGLTATATRLSWEPPPLAERNGKIVKYVVVYRDINSQNESADTTEETHVSLSGLRPDTTYDIRVQAFTAKGGGPLSPSIQSRTMSTAMSVFTQNFGVKAVTKTSVLLTWDVPETFESEVPLKILYNQQSVEVRGERKRMLITQLSPDTDYSFVLMSRGNSAGGLQQQVSVRTPPDLLPNKPSEYPQDVEEGGKVTLRLPRVPPEAPVRWFYIVVVPVTPASLRWENPEDMDLQELLDGEGDAGRKRRHIESDFLRPYVAAKLDSLPDIFTLGDGHAYHGFRNKALPGQQQYRCFVLVELMNGESQRTLAASPFSEAILVKLHSGMARHSEDSEMLWVMGPVLAVILIVIIVIAILLFKRKRTCPSSKDEHMADVKDSLLAHSSDPVEMRRLNYQTQGGSTVSCPTTPRMRQHPPIATCDLADHIERLKANDGLRFSQEYESIDPGQQFTWEHSNMEINKPKNRYANVTAYDHSRVLLTPVDGVLGSDYINGNYVDGYRKQNAYIATQGPLPDTLGDFWRLVWEQRTCTVVMMTRLEEKSRVKCEQYWPSRGTETYGMIQVTVLDTVELATYSVRTFALYKNGSSERREVRQFQFMAWPDHGVPEYPTPTLAFLRRVKACNPPDAGPMVVHCSAGVGRTGCFMVIDAMLERMKHEHSVDVYGHVTCMRAQRNYMVQTEDQYVFIHEALLEAAVCGNTEVAARNLYAHIHKLSQVPTGETVTAMELEFKKLANSKAHTSRFISANLPCNKFKNRLVNIMPFESSRVCLQPIRGVEGSDYINASFIDGYRMQRAYMATQGPLAETTEDFWRMLWEHNSTIVVMLTKLREMGREKCHQYWPAERSARYQYFVVDPMAEYNMPQYVLREFKVTDARDGQSRTIRQFQFSDWPEQGVPKNGEGFIDFIGQVHKTKEQFGQDGPITVHCSAGVGRSGVFITLSVVLERMRYEGALDVFHTVKTLRTQRPAMVQTEDQYQLCYRAALEYLGSFDHYAT